MSAGLTKGVKSQKNCCPKKKDLKERQLRPTSTACFDALAESFRAFYDAVSITFHQATRRCQLDEDRRGWMMYENLLTSVDRPRSEIRMLSPRFARQIGSPEGIFRTSFKEGERSVPLSNGVDFLLCGHAGRFGPGF